MGFPHPASSSSPPHLQFDFIRDGGDTLPSVMDPKLWLVKCKNGYERAAAIAMMKKYFSKGSGLKIKSAIALDHLKGFIYIEADKKDHVKEACKGMSGIYSTSVSLVPTEERADVLSANMKAIDESRVTWVRMKTGTYRGDLARVVDKDDLCQKVTVRIIPRIDLQALAKKKDGDLKKKAVLPPPRLLIADEAREMHINVERRRDLMTGQYFEYMKVMKFKDGFLYKTVSKKSIITQNIQPTFDELEKFYQPGDSRDGDVTGHFMIGDEVIVVEGAQKDSIGLVERVEEESLHVRLRMRGVQDESFDVCDKNVSKYFAPGLHVKVVSGASKGATGLVLKFDGPDGVIILSDRTKELRVSAGNLIKKSSEVTPGVTRTGDYELHDLVQLDKRGFGVIVRAEIEDFQVLKGFPERPEVVDVGLRDLKCKLESEACSVDRFKRTILVKDFVRIRDGPYTGDDSVASTSAELRNTPLLIPKSPRVLPRGRPPSAGGRHRDGRACDPLVGSIVKICEGPSKGYRGRVVDVTGSSVTVELEATCKRVSVERDQIKKL